jgi:hypothetical protein
MPREQASLIHNMSAPPKSVVSYAGLGGLSSVSGSGGTGRRGARPDDDRAFGASVNFRLDPEMTARTARGILQRLGARTGPDPDATLVALIERRAAELPLPDGCLVIPTHPGARHRLIWPDLLSVLAVLSKCSEHVWLRAKCPSLSAALSRRQATLFVPPPLGGRLPKEDA